MVELYNTQFAYKPFINVCDNDCYVSVKCTFLPMKISAVYGLVLRRRENV